MKKIVIILFFGLTQIMNSQWKSCSKGIEEKNITSLGIIGNNIFASAIYVDDDLTTFRSDGLYRSTNSGENWSVIDDYYTNNAIITCMAVKDEHIYAGVLGGLLLSTNNGNSWEIIKVKEPYAFVYTIAISGDKIFIGTDDGVYLSVDNGDSWIKKTTGVKEIFSLAANNNYIFYGAKGNIFRSSDNGEKWENKNFKGITVNDNIKVVVSGGDKIFIVCESYSLSNNSGIYMSKDDGDNWLKIDSGLSKSKTNSLIIHENLIFAGKNDGVFLSIDYGASWNEINEGLDDIFYPDCFAVLNGHIYGGSYKGVYRAKISDLLTSVDDEKHSEFALSISPNPFNQFTTINYQLTISERVRLDVFNSLGEKITTLVDELQEAGSHNATFEAAGLSQGVYYYRIQIGERIESGKLLLIR